MESRLRTLGIGIAVFLCGSLGGALAYYGYLHLRSQPLATELRDDVGGQTYQFIKPLLLITTPEDTGTYAPLKSALEKYVATARAEGRAQDISVYFRDLDASKWVGVNETEIYKPSSMLKVLVMIAYLRDAERAPQRMTALLPYTHTQTAVQHYPPSTTLAAGSYSANELINRMIIDSDNDAAVSLLSNVDQTSLRDAYASLDIPNGEASSTLNDFMSPQEYSRIFRVLYNATYLSHAVSEQALTLLAHTTFTEGLVAGVPSSITVAHKFGENAETVDGTREDQLHDCGIIYAPDTPYFLCVMTRGTDFDSLSGVIADISRMTYQSVIQTP